MRSVIHLREEVVHNMVLNNAVEKVTANESEITINSGQSTLDKGPVLGIKVRDVDVGVVEVGNGN